MHKISNRIFEIFFKKTLDFLLAGFRRLSKFYLEICSRLLKVNCTKVHTTLKRSIAHVKNNEKMSE